jgi:hypothetical protein
MSRKMEPAQHGISAVNVASAAFRRSGKHITRIFASLSGPTVAHVMLSILNRYAALANSASLCSTPASRRKTLWRESSFKLKVAASAKIRDFGSANSFNRDVLTGPFYSDRGLEKHGSTPKGLRTTGVNTRSRHTYNNSSQAASSRCTRVKHLA